MIAEQLNQAIKNLKESRENIIIKGGNIAENAGFNALPKAILDLPVGKASVVEVVDDSTAYNKAILAGAKPKAILNSIGGMTYRRASDNLFPCPNEGITRIVEPMIGLGEVYLPAGTYSYSVEPTYEYEEDRFSYLGFMSNPDNASDPTGYVELSTPFTLTETTKVYLIGIKDGALVGGNVTVKVMLNDGSTVKAFSAYFQPYLEDTKATEVISHGANLIPFPYETPSGTYYGITYTVNDDGSVKVQGTATGEHTFYLINRNRAEVKILPNIPITVSGGVAATSNSGAVVVNVRRYKANGSTASFIESKGNSSTGQIAEGETLQLIGIYIAKGLTVDAVVYPMLNYGTTAVLYTPYREPIRYPIPEAIQAQMSGKGVGAYADTADFDNGKYIKRMHTVVLTGAENWKYGTRTDPTKLNFYIDDPIGKTLTPVACNYFDSDVGRSTGMDNNMWISGTGKLNCTAVGFASTAEWKAHLAKLYSSSNPVTITYALAEPTETDLAAAFDKKIEVFPGGYLEFVNDKQNPVPSKITYIRSIE